MRQPWGRHGHVGAVRLRVAELRTESSITPSDHELKYRLFPSLVVHAKLEPLRQQLLQHQPYLLLRRIICGLRLDIEPIRFNPIRSS